MFSAARVSEQFPVGGRAALKSGRLREDHVLPP
jgi:hypothetical protein